MLDRRDSEIPEAKMRLDSVWLIGKFEILLCMADRTTKWKKQLVFVPKRRPK